MPFITRGNRGGLAQTHGPGVVYPLAWRAVAGARGAMIERRLARLLLVWKADLGAATQ